MSLFVSFISLLNENESGNDTWRGRLFNYTFVCGKQLTFHGKGLAEEKGGEK